MARNLAALGLPALMVTRVGNDRYGDQVREAFAGFGMSTEGLQHGPQPTGRVLVERDGNGGHRFHILAEQAYDHIEAAAAIDVMRAFSPDTVYFGTLAQREPASRAALNAVLDGASEAEHFLDLNLRDGVDEAVVFAALQRADIVKVNEDELQALFSWYCHTCPDTVDMDCAAVEAEVRAMMHNFSIQGCWSRWASAAPCISALMVRAWSTTAPANRPGSSTRWERAMRLPPCCWPDVRAAGRCR